MEEPLPAHTAPKKQLAFRLLITGGIVLIAATIAALVWWQSRPNPPNSTTHTNTTSSLHADIEQTTKQKEVTWPLYYPKALPVGFRYTQGSVTLLEKQALNFTITSPNGKSITISEQRRPALMEEVKKTRQFTTPVGSGYIADLEDRIVGFLLTDETLIIASPASGTINDTLLSEVLNNMIAL